MNKKDYVLRISVIFLAFSFPFVCLFNPELKNSLSSSWYTSLKPLFITVNAATAYFLFSLDNWKTPSIFLLLLTAFSVEDYGLLHNIFATIFFLSVIYSIHSNSRLKWYLIPYCSSLLLAPFGLLYLEIVCVCTMCVFHAHLLYLKWNVDFNRKKIQQDLVE